MSKSCKCSCVVACLLYISECTKYVQYVQYILLCIVYLCVSVLSMYECTILVYSNMQCNVQNTALLVSLLDPPSWSSLRPSSVVMSGTKQLSGWRRGRCCLWSTSRRWRRTRKRQRRQQGPRRKRYYSRPVTWDSCKCAEWWNLLCLYVCVWGVVFMRVCSMWVCGLGQRM